jgi:indolepyruvate ferredoxin oxidoreductase beta subunit
MVKEINLLIAGVGGQGGVLLTRIIALSAVKEDLQALIHESRGGAQRGGTVISQIRIGREVYSPVIPANRGDVLLGLEPIEAVRTAYSYLKENGVVLLNTNPVLPVLVQMGSMEYPSIELLTSFLKEITNKIIRIEAADIAERAGNRMAANMVMLGALIAIRILPIHKKTILETLTEEVSGWAKEVDLRAFNLGLNELEQRRDNYFGSRRVT